jgi:hypothetical protein
MDNKISLFSRARPAKPVEKKIRGFLALPGELRNGVYRHYFPDNFRCEIVGDGTDFDPLGHKMMKLGLVPVWFRYMSNVRKPEWQPFKPRASTTVRISRHLGKSKHTRVDGLRTNWSSSLCALIFVCKQIHSESIVFLYQSTTFVFNAPRRINNFLMAFPSANLAMVTRLELHYTNYGHSWLTLGNKCFRRDHLVAWTTACKAMAKQLVNLHELHLWLYITDSPLWFDLRQEWLTPLLPFRCCCVAAQTSALKTGAAGAKTSEGPRAR